MDPAALIREYLLLGLRFDKLESGYVDSYIGDPALRRQVDNEPAPNPAELARQAEQLAAQLPRGNGFDPARAHFIAAQLRAGLRRPKVRRGAGGFPRRGSRLLRRAHRQGRAAALP